MLEVSKGAKLALINIPGYINWKQFPVNIPGYIEWGGILYGKLRYALIVTEYEVTHLLYERIVSV